MTWVCMMDVRPSRYVLLCLLLQLVCMLAVSLAAFHPLNSLLTALQTRGFLKAADRPTLLKVRVNRSPITTTPYTSQHTCRKATHCM